METQRRELVTLDTGAWGSRTSAKEVASWTLVVTLYSKPIHYVYNKMTRLMFA